MAHDIAYACIPAGTWIPVGSQVWGTLTVTAEGGWWGDDYLAEGEYTIVRITPLMLGEVDFPAVIANPAG
jgi:hypothetical protein